MYSLKMYRTECRTGKTMRTLVAALILCGAFGIANGQPQAYDATPETIQQIYRNQSVYEGRTVDLPAPVIVRSVNRSGEGESRSFTVQDEAGNGIRVLTSEALPEVYEPYRISGTVQLRKDAQIPYVVATSIEGPLGGPPTWLIVAIGGLLVAIGALGTYLVTRRRNRESAHSAAGRDRMDRSSPRERKQGSTYEGETVRMDVPPLETVKMLGRLEVISGHEDPEIPLLVPPSNGSAPSDAGHSFTIGRAPASMENRFRHIQIKPRTVSREQAKLSFEGGTFRLTNYVSEAKNPTLVNGQALGVNEEIKVSAGDTITMGEVKLRLHAGPRT